MKVVHAQQPGEAMQAGAREPAERDSRDSTAKDDSAAPDGGTLEPENVVPPEPPSPPSPSQRTPLQRPTQAGYASGREDAAVAHNGGNGGNGGQGGAGGSFPGLSVVRNLEVRFLGLKTGLPEARGLLANPEK